MEDHAQGYRLALKAQPLNSGLGFALLETMDIPTNNIYWRDIPTLASVVLISNCYVVNEYAVAYWTGNEAREAQKLLNAKVERTAREAKVAQAAREAKMAKTQTYSIELRPLEKFGADLRHCQIDITAPLVYTAGKGFSHHGAESPDSNRVMPLNDEGKLLRLIKRQTKLCSGLDASHFWVSGYYSVHFLSKGVVDRKKMKRIVERAVKEIGFQTFEQWMEGHEANKKSPHMIIATGTGSSIRVSGLCGDPAYM